MTIQTVYCITHEHEVIIGPAGHHVVFGQHECGCTDVGNTTDCYGPFTQNAPEELPEDWQDFMTEPSAEELEQMDINAEEILLNL